MLKRLISGSVYVAILVGFFFLRLVHTSLFGILICAFSIIGTFEMLQAFSYKKVLEDGTLSAPKAEISLAQKIAVTVFAALLAPCYYAVTYFYPEKNHTVILAAFFILVLVLLVLLVFDKNSSLDGFGASLVAGVYPNALLCTMLLINDLNSGATLALLLTFTVSPIADSFAYIVGSIIKGKKLCPNISPNKTISGAIGGVVFGTAGAVLIYFLYTLATPYVYEGVLNPWITFALLGFIASIVTEFGDLVESVIKRKIGIKDMGKIMPGHGGILDRIDGTLFASAFIYLFFVLFII